MMRYRHDLPTHAGKLEKTAQNNKHSDCDPRQQQQLIARIGNTEDVDRTEIVHDVGDEIRLRAPDQALQVFENHEGREGNQQLQNRIFLVDTLHERGLHQGTEYTADDDCSQRQYQQRPCRRSPMCASP